MRLQVFLSHNGVCSRRKAFDLVQAGRVTVNGRIVTEPSTPVDPAKDTVAVDGKFVRQRIHEYLLLNKPAGYVTTRKDPFAKKTIYDLFPKEFHHLVPVGRLDKDTEGLLLLTNDGDLVHRLTHPRFEVKKTYLVRIGGTLILEKRKRLAAGIVLDGKKTAPAQIRNVQILKNETQFEMTIHEGRKRQIREMCKKVGCQVTALKRIGEGKLTLGNLDVGQWKVLRKNQF